jgi:hypothetical protein
MAIWVWILIIIAAAIVGALVAITVFRGRTMALRRRFGPEYDRAVQGSESRRAGEADLRGRQKQRALLEIKPLPDDMRARYSQEWRHVQERFVDRPSDAVAAADMLVHRVLAARGYPVGDFDAQADLVSVDHPEVVDNYRVAHGIYEQAQALEASTEDLREALLRYRSLFDKLLQTDGQTSVLQRPGA